MSNRRPAAPSDYEKAKKETPLQLQCQLDRKEISTVKVYYRVGARERKAELPVNAMEQSEAILFAISEFQSFRDTHNINARNSFIHFRETLNGTARTDWDTAMMPYAAVADQTNASFLTARNTFLLTFFSDKAYDNLVKYLDLVHKPNKMSELQLSTRLKTIQLYSTFLPPSTDPQMELTDLRIKKIYFHMQPIPMQTQYNISGRPRLEDAAVTLTTLQDFFTELETAPLMHSPYYPGNNNNNNNNNDRDSGRGNGNGGGGGRRNQRGGRRNQQQRRRGRGNDNDDRSNK